jgi:uncharacterized membrane protein
MKRNSLPIAILVIGLLFLPLHRARAQSDLPVVRAVLFYSPTCGHCQFVIEQTILPMIQQYGNQLQIMGVDVTQPQGQQLFLAALQKFGLDRGGVPYLLIDNIHLTGSVEIPERFPGLVETYLRQGGVDWPNIPGLNDILPTPTGLMEVTALPLTPRPSPLSTPVPASVSPAVPSPTVNPVLDLGGHNNLTWRERFALDRAGNTLSVFILMGMIGAVIWGFILFQNSKGVSPRNRWSWVVPALCVIGMGIAGYLAYVETRQVEAVCGPVGDCNTVQQSEYARLFGILPIGVLGLIGYAAILGSWLVAYFTTGRLAKLAPLANLVMTVVGTLFSIYLTFLEPFVIGATCAWCLTSAVLMTVLMLLSIAPAKFALAHLSERYARGGRTR